MAWHLPGDKPFWTNDGILLIWPLGTNRSKMLIKIPVFSFTKMRLKVSSAKWRSIMSRSQYFILYILIGFAVLFPFEFSRSMEITKFMGPKGAHLGLVGPRWAHVGLWTLLSGEWVLIARWDNKDHWDFFPLQPMMGSVMHAPSGPPMTVANHWPVAEIGLSSIFSG